MGNYGSAALDLAGLGAGGLALKLERMEARTLGNRTPDFMDAWYGLRAAEYARRAQGVSALSFGASWLLNALVNPDEARAMLCP